MPALTLHLTLLGGYEARDGKGRPVTFTRKKAQALLAYAALGGSRVHSRDKLTTLLWDDVDRDAARHNLRQTLLAIRQAMPRGARAPLTVDRDGITVDPGALAVDVREFERCVTEGTPEALARAADLYRGDLLSGIGRHGAMFEEWLQTERSRLRELAIAARAQLLSHQLHANLVQPAIDTANALLSLDPLQEQVHRTLMQLHAGQGNRAAALRQYEVCIAALRREVAAEPERETKDLYQSILRQRTRGVRPEPPRPGAVLIGRDRELALLDEAIEASGSSRGRIAFVEGEAGLGKTALVTTMAARAIERGASVLFGRAYEGERLVPFGPWLDAFRRAQLEADRTLLAALAPAERAELSRLLPALGDGVRQPPAAPLDHVRLFEAIAASVRELATRQPVVLVLEDLHWADEMSLRLLSFLATRAAGWRPSIVTTARSEELPSATVLRDVLSELSRTPGLTRISLEPLTRPDVGRLVAARAHTACGDNTERVTALVWLHSQGNPLIAVETVEALQDGDVQTEAGAASLPQRVRQVIAARLDHLSDEARRVVDVACVIGRDFEFAVLQRAAGLDEEEAAARVEQLLRRRVLRGDGERLDFTHDCIREVGYERLLPPRRQLLHRRVADALELTHIGDRSWHAMLATHYRAAEVWPKAVEYGASFAEQAAQAYALEQAVVTCTQAIGDAARLPLTERDRWIVQVALRQADALFWLSRIPEIVTALEPHRERVERVGDARLAGTYHFLVALAGSFLGDRERMVAHAQLALEAAVAAGDGMMAGRAHALVSLDHEWAGRPREGARHAQAAIDQLEPGGDIEWLCISHLHLALAHCCVGDADAALPSIARAQALADATQNRRLQSFAAWVLVWPWSIKDPAEAVKAGRRAVDLAPDPMTATISQAWLGYACLEAGDAAAALAVLAPAVERSSRSGFRAQHAWFTSWLGEALLADGQIERARQVLCEASRLVEAANFPLGVGLVQRARGRLALADGDLDGARRCFAAAVIAFTAAEAEYETHRTQRLVHSETLTRKLVSHERTREPECE